MEEGIEVNEVPVTETRSLEDLLAEKERVITEQAQDIINKALEDVKALGRTTAVQETRLSGVVTKIELFAIKP